MIGEDDLDQIANALRRLDEAQRKSERELAAARAQIEALVGLLIAKDVLAEGHRRHLDMVARGSDPAGERKVRLRMYIDKYNMNEGEPIDCAERLHLCRARCCSFRVELTQQDVDERQVRWELLEPYVMQRGADGYCHYLDRGTGGCTNYEFRPATCREYTCRDDKRVWIDFEKMIPAPIGTRDDGPA